MLKFIIRRVLLMIPILFGVSLITFIIVRFIPGDPVMVLLGADRRSTPEQIENIRRAYGLDQSYVVQYFKWLQHVLTGDLGKSLRTGRPLTQELGLRLPVTAQLTIFAAILGTIPAVIAGTAAAIKRNSPLDYATTVTSLIGISLPNFFLATLLVLLFSFKLKWLPNVGWRSFFDDPVLNLKLMILPSLSLALPLMAILMRFTRSAVLETLNQDYVRTARAKGLKPSKVVRKHVLPNAGIPVLTVVGIQVASLLGGAVIVEQIFALPGVGRYIYEAIQNRDYPVVQSVTLVLATIFVTVSLVVDILYAFLDPRLRHS
ncbi:MAG: ABC transporter permease [Thermomicrobiales bacterium]|nr:ABC transporter permease [Thermomicrobiales bacterium]MCO5228881.1 ABC transporter permease [Thermomicrobiales bacterium]